MKNSKRVKKNVKITDKMKGPTIRAKEWKMDLADFKKNGCLINGD